MGDAALATDLVRAAGRLALRMRRQGIGAETKSSVSDLVTAADRAAEQLVLDRLRRSRPEDSVLGEEGTRHAGLSGRTWVIDPVDGTWNFVHGLHHWCSAIALTDSAGVRLGAVYSPVQDRVWVGGPQRPPKREGVLLPALEDASLGEVGAATYLHPTRLAEESIAGPWRRAAAGAATIRMLGSGSMDLAAVAEGRIGCWFQHGVPSWDWLPGQALVLGVGGAAEQVEVAGHVWSVAGRRSAVAEVIAALTG